MPEPLISVVIPTYNRAQLLMRSLQSVLAQTWQRLEVIVVDDASSDDTQVMLHTVEDERVRVIRLDKQCGAAAARNAGILAARGELIAFQDSDDAWLPEKLDIQLACLQAHSADMTFCAFQRCKEDGAPWQTFPPATVPGGEIKFTDLLFENLASTQTMLFAAPFLRSLLFDERYPALEDWELALRAARQGRVVYLPHPLVKVTLRADSLSNHQDRALAALRLLFADYAPYIRADERICAQWIAAFVHAGRHSGCRTWRDCLRLLSPCHSLRLNAAIVIRAAKELLYKVGD